MKEPNIRFQEFNDEWEVKLFGTYINEYNELTSDKMKYPLYSLTIEDGIVPKPERYEREHLITKGGDSYKIVPPNAFVYNPMNLRFGALKVNHEDFPVCVSGYYDVFFMGNEETLKFWENYLVSGKMLNYYYSIATGSLIEKLRVHFSQFVNIKKPLPSLAEQKKISNLFENIDDVILAMESEVALWEEKKKGVMQKIFSQEVRFKRDDESKYPEWEKKKLEEVVFFLDGKRKPLEGKQRVSGIYPYYGASGIIDYIEDYIFDEENILLSEDGANIVSRTYRVSFLARGKYWVNNHAHVLHPQNDNNAIFICEQLESIDYGKYNSGSAQPKLNQEVCRKIPIIMPCIEEQQKIADCLSSIDEVIKIKKEKLVTWKNIKKGLLQQMFV